MEKHGFTLTAVAVVLAISAEAGEININVHNRGVGHTWAVIICDHAIAKISFGPAKPDDIATIFTHVPSTNNYHTGLPTVSHTILLNEPECGSMIEQVKNTEGTSYRLLVHNCTTAVLEVLKTGGVNLHSDAGGLRQYLSLPFATPASLAMELRKLNSEEALRKLNPEEAKKREKQVRERMRWRCNYRNYLHLVPSECAHPELGGSWEVMQ